MEATKAIILIKSYIKSYALYYNLMQVGLSADNYEPDYIDVLSILFDFNNENKDEYSEIFYSESEKLLGEYNLPCEFPDEKLTSTALEIYSGWKAMKQGEQLNA